MDRVVICGARSSSTWAIEVGVRYHLSGMSLLEESNFLDILASTGVTSPFVSGLIKLIYSRSRQFLRIRLQLTKRLSASMTRSSGCTAQSTHTRTKLKIGSKPWLFTKFIIKLPRPHQVDTNEAVDMVITIIICVDKTVYDSSIETKPGVY